MPGADLSKYTTAELQAMLAQSQPAAPAVGGDLSQVPTEQLQAMLPPATPEATPAPAQAGILGTGPEAAPKPTIAPRSAGEALGRGILQGASFGFGDELSGGIGALIGSDPALGQTFDAPTLGGRYQQARDFYRAKNRGAQEAYGKTYLGGQLLGGIAAPGGLAARGATGLTGAARIAYLAKLGGATGALAGAGAAEGDFGDTLGSALRGGVTGAILSPLADAGTRALAAPVAKLASGLRTGAGYALSRVAGGIQRDVSPTGGPAAFSRAGLQGYDEGLIRPWDFLPEPMSRQSARVAAYAKQSTDDIVTAIDNAGARVQVAPLQQALQAASADLRQFPSANGAPLARVDGLIDDLGNLSDPAGTVSARTLQTAKKTIDNLISTWDPTRQSKLAQDLNKALYRSVADAQEQAVGASGTAASVAAYQAAKKSSSLAQNLERFQQSFEARRANQLANVGGLHGALGGIAGLQHFFASGDPLAAAATYVGTRALTSPRTAALGMLGASKLARLAPQYAASELNPLIARSAAQAIVSSLDEPRRPLGALR